jgi:methylated-DNA-[protein]-cysteine S-methyltransferase
MHAPLPLFDTWIDSPVGPLRLLADDEGVAGIYFAAHRGAPTLTATACPTHPHLHAIHAELRRYFGGEDTPFTTTLVTRGTAFQEAVWVALRALPYGATPSYAELAAALGRPGAARAVGAAVAANPISIVIPCHRVVGARGLTGYAGGVPAKAWLLDHEARHRRDPAAAGPLFAAARSSSPALDAPRP